MDFVSDQLYNGKRFRALTLIDTYSRECVAIHADKAIKGDNVVEVLERVREGRGLPKKIKVDNGPEFISRALDAWVYFNKVKLEYSRPGKPTDNPHIESFNGSLRDECLNIHWFMSLEDARQKIENWRKDYNEFRPHSGLTYKTPAEFAAGATSVYLPSLVREINAEACRITLQTPALCSLYYELIYRALQFGGHFCQFLAGSGDFLHRS
jgi:putative transposase